MKIDIFASGAMKSTAPYQILWDDYSKRLNWKVNLFEFNHKDSQKVNAQIEKKLVPSAFTYVLDETGKALSSTKFASRINTHALHGESHLQFVIGPHDGLSPTLKKNADYLLSFGQQTWPHMLIRIMLIEQLYRAQQITAGHPYHK
jgi:23S rRNA (pseudouridine1915-N3)-methyltransferase